MKSPWVNVNDGLPKESGDYLTYDGENYGVLHFEKGERSPWDTNHCYDCGHHQDEPLFWMSYPKVET